MPLIAIAKAKRIRARIERARHKPGVTTERLISLLLRLRLTDVAYFARSGNTEMVLLCKRDMRPFCPRPTFYGVNLS